ncbi:MAG: nickel-type superoxide dismutase maturation protease [Anaerolineales bacterium]|nr:nickel-type superoxide dismutase maturation protease [Anaerolineales bacterium]MCB0012950.1 nickel-type superoxide dismutase maturation protease [Anaerolineales bacterium]
MDGLRASQAGDYWRWLCRRYRRFRVTGRSMLPTLNPGTELLYNPHAYQQQAPAPGDIVIAQHPQQPDLPIVKRVELILPDGAIVLRGDNRAESSDSLAFGPVAPALILGRVICTFP